MAAARAIITPSTACIVILTEPRFENSAGAEDPDSITMYMNMTFNGVVGSLGDSVTFARNATQLQKQAAVRAKVNALIASYEPGVVLNSANIQITGMPV